VRPAGATALLVRGARRLGVPRFLRRIPDREVDAYAFAVGYMLSAKTWMVRRRAAPWPAVHAAWRRAVADPAATRTALSGPLDAADEVALLTDGPAAFAARDRLYAEARASLDISTYYVQSDDTGWDTARALQAAARRGVRVRLLVDRLMTDKKRCEVAGIDQLLDALRRGGVEVRQWHDPARPYDSNHRKLILADRRTAVVGGRNFAGHYRDGGWRDVDLVGHGPTAARLALLFEDAWAGRSGRGAYAPWFDHVPGRLADDPAMRYVLACVAAAGTTIDAELAYFVGPAVLADALVAALARGVRVRVFTNAAEANDLPYTNYAVYAAMRRLLEAGAEVFARRGHDRTLHSKYVVVDGAWVAAGSHNLDYYSSRFCCETTLHVHSERLGRALTGFFETEAGDGTRVTLDGDVRPFLRRQWALRGFDRVFRDFQ
jgi:cardiolipin synthase